MSIKQLWWKEAWSLAQKHSRETKSELNKIGTEQKCLENIEYHFNSKHLVGYKRRIPDLILIIIHNWRRNMWVDESKFWSYIFALTNRASFCESNTAQMSMRSIIWLALCRNSTLKKEWDGRWRRANVWTEDICRTRSRLDPWTNYIWSSASWSTLPFIKAQADRRLFLPTSLFIWSLSSNPLVGIQWVND